MIRLAAVVFSMIVCLNGYLANQDCEAGDTFFGRTAEELAPHCGAYCFSAMKPVLGYVKANQHLWDTCEKGTSPDLSQINEKLWDLKETLAKAEESLNSMENHRFQENLLNRLGNIENQLKEVRDEKKIMQNQPKTGLKFIYIYNNDEQSSTNTCSQMGGRLASIEKNKESDNSAEFRLY